MYDDSNNSNLQQQQQQQQLQQQQNQHLVIPGQLIAVSAVRNNNNRYENNNNQKSIDNDDNFLRGHGTYVEIGQNSIDGTIEQRLYASTVGIVRRVNKLINVETICYNTFYRGQVGDLIIGRIVSIANGKWKVSLGSGRDAILPLQGVHLPGGIQRIRTSEDVLSMRQFLQENDLISAEVHKITVVGVSINTSAMNTTTTTTPGSSNGNDNTTNTGGSTGAGLGDGSGIIRLHTRSIKYGKLENGCLIIVPSSLILRRKNHYVTILNNTFQLLLGCNGFIWIQRNTILPNSSTTTTTTTTTTTLSTYDEKMDTDVVVDKDSNNTTNNNGGGMGDLIEIQEQRRMEHKTMPYSYNDRKNLARVRNSIECLKRGQIIITITSIEFIYNKSIELFTSTSTSTSTSTTNNSMKRNNNNISDMLQPNNVILLLQLLKEQK